MSKYNIIPITVAMIGFAFVNETLYVTAQSNSTSLDKRNIVVTRPDANNTKTIDTPVFSVSNEDFWKMFESLLKLPINGSASSFE